MSEGSMALSAARHGDDIGHDFGLVGMVAGALAGAAIGAAIVAAGVATGGVAIAAVVGGAIAMGGLSGGSLAHGIQEVCDIPDPTTGTLTSGSPDTFVNGQRAQRAGVDGVACCNGLYNFNHWSKRVRIAQGSSTVWVNGAPMARTSDKMECGATIKAGSSNVVVGGAAVTVLTIYDAEAAFQTALELLGVVSLGLAGAAVFAAGGLEAVLGLGAVVVLTGEGISELKSWGDSLGSGWGDIFAGVAGFALLGLGAKFSGPSQESPVVNADRFTSDRPPPGPRLVIDDKIRAQMKERGWSQSDIESTVRDGATGRTIDKRSAGKTPDGVARDDPASVYGSPSAYVVVNDRTGEIVQLSSRRVSDWIPDGRIKWNE